MSKTIYIVGLGLIGASMALGIKRDHPDYEILGYNRSKPSRDIALERGMIDRATDDFASFAPLADIIILTLPIKQTIAFIQELASLGLKEGVLISDAGSTKSAICERSGGEFCRGSLFDLSVGIPWQGAIRQVLPQPMSISLKMPTISLLHLV